MTRNFTLIVNPAAGGGATHGVASRVERDLQRAGARVTVAVPARGVAGDAAVAEAVHRGDVVVAVGGDGTVSALAGKVARHGGVLGIIPAGRGNDFARMLGLPRDPAAQVDVLLEAGPRAVDLISARRVGAGPRLLAGSVYAGVDAWVADRVSRGHWLPRRLQYPVTALRALATFRPTRLFLTIDGVDHRFTAACVAVANSAYYGSGMRIAPEASIDDGLLDVVVIEAFGRLDMVRALPQIYSGRHVALPSVHVFRGSSVTLSAEPAVLHGGDGETLGLLGSDPVRLDAVPAAVRILH